MTLAYIGLGSNQGDSLATLQSALKQLAEHAEIEVQAVSSFYQTKPVGPQEQPDYVNAVAALKTSLNAQALLAVLLEVERLHGRVRDPNLRWGPRTLDLDLLLFGEAVIQEANLIVPHPELCKRAFVVYPLVELAPDLVLPNRVTLKACQAQLDVRDLFKIVEQVA
ncbi:2-amino-4-hydroxy-6-hydroxymethyldihydropteridine diphosphokinase [uncultured Thiothrix sp.]|uniref:2-amino-4-hydroxy-6- hydroxymethyldihydropteridine diphosphokinase n=1 Tax=uncultured Thiothrix sp. TaxID=223185 RepID=UPI00262404E6|nr:2-amino-4-hydroxy-6-hydroxymethyldihydropteridine diphosphokinase [uncultured Thiothrix sp.]